jgi:C-terminal processing protease CtpA/Prc
MRPPIPLLAAALAIGCASASAPPATPPAPPPPARTYRDLAQQAEPPAHPADYVIEPAALAADLDLLAYALDRGYGGRRYVPEPAFQALRARLDALRAAPLTVTAFCDALGDALWELPDAHTRASRRVGDGGSRTVCGARFKAAQRKPSVGKPYAAAEAARPWVADFLAVGHANFGVLAIHRFPSHEDPVWGDYNRAVEEIASTDGILVDLRGNGGGDDSRGLHLASAILDAPAAFDFARIRTRATPEAFTLYLNTVDRGARGADGVLASWATGRYAEATRDRDEAAGGAEEERVREEPTRAEPGPNAFHGPVAVLVDSDCASSCETTLQALRKHPRARVFGERTGGYVNFGDVGSLTLPNSGVEVGIPTKYFEFPDGRIYDKTGFEPDVAVPAGQDAFDAATAWLIEGEGKARVVAPAEYVVPDASRAREAERLAKLGVEVPAGGAVLERPYAAPFGRRSFVVPGGWLPRRTPAVVYAPALLADLSALEDVMRRAYGGWEHAAKRGWDWDAWFSDWRRQLGAEGARWLAVKDAFEPVRRLERFQLDNHTTIPLGLRSGSGSRVYRLASAPGGACDAARDQGGHALALDAKDAAQQPHTTDRFDGKDLARASWIAAPAVRGDLAAIHCGGAWIPLVAVPQPGWSERLAQVNELAGQAEDRPALKHLDEDVAVLRLPTFSKQNGEIFLREHDRWDRPTGKEKALVVDLRGNGGGDAVFGALAGWVGADELGRITSFEQRTGASCLYPALRWGYANLSSFALKPPLTTEMAKRLSASVHELFEKDDPACPARFKLTRDPHPYGTKRARRPPPRRGKPRLVVLVDGGCGSDCEYMVSSLARLPEAVVVGVNTYGVAEYIQPGYSVLPNTRLPFRIALGTAPVYGDGRSVDGYGLDVDVLVDGAGAWTKEAILKLVGRLEAR